MCMQSCQQDSDQTLPSKLWLAKIRSQNFLWCLPHVHLSPIRWNKSSLREITRSRQRVKAKVPTSTEGLQQEQQNLENLA